VDDEVMIMGNELETIRQIESFERMGKELCLHASSSPPDERLVDAAEFHRWRVEVSKLFFLTLGSSNHYYQRFWKTVTRPSLKDVEEGLKVLAMVRHELEEIFPRDSSFCRVNVESAAS